MKLWQKQGSEILKEVESFTVGNDAAFDLLLAKYDVQGTIAHVTMLGEVGLLSVEEANTAVAALNDVAAEIATGKFTIEPGIEDVHSQVEYLLTQRIGDIGKKIHSGRSRNDQVAVDIKLYLRDELSQLKTEIAALFELLIRQSEKYKGVLLPGYTHLQLAMPSSAGLWLSAYAESLVDDAELLLAAYNIVNKNPLGSGAGYGSSFPLNRHRTTELLGFAAMNVNSVYAQMSRGKTEKAVAVAAAAIASSLGKLSMDCTLYLNQNFGFIYFPDTLTTGSSIMPHKKNPDVFEIIRGKCSGINALPNELTLLLHNLPSGYHRDVQLTKEILFPALQDLKSCLRMMQLMISEIGFKPNLLENETYKYLFTVEAINKLVNEGVPFREAYQKIGKAVADGCFEWNNSQLLDHTHEGSIGNLQLGLIEKAMQNLLCRIP